MRSASAIIISCTKPIAHLPQIVTNMKNGSTKGYKGSTMMQAL